MAVSTALLCFRPCRQAVFAANFVRKSAAGNNDEELLAGMIDQMLKSTESASRAIDDALDFITASNERIDALEANNKAH